jgi:hypothetical protein
MRSARSLVGRVTLAAFAMVLLGPPSAWAQQAGPKSHSGEFVKAGQGEFTMTMGGQNEHSHKVGDRTHYTLNGKEASLKDLKPGDLISVTTESGNTLAVDATRPPEKTAP